MSSMAWHLCGADHDAVLGGRGEEQLVPPGVMLEEPAGGHGGIAMQGACRGTRKVPRREVRTEDDGPLGGEGPSRAGRRAATPGHR